VVILARWQGKCPTVRETEEKREKKGGRKGWRANLEKAGGPDKGAEMPRHKNERENNKKGEKILGFLSMEGDMRPGWK